MVVEALLVVYLTLLFGFRPVTTTQMDLRSIEIGADGYGLTEAFRKGYTAKTVPLRRMTVPWADFPEVQALFQYYFTHTGEKSGWKYLGPKKDSATEVMKYLKICAAVYGMKYHEDKYITAYSLRISCCSYLFAANVTAERIKLWIGWAIDSNEWFRYVRHVEVCEEV